MNQTYLCPLHHYLSSTISIANDPNPYFSEEYYQEHYPDVAEVIKNGSITKSAYMHFIRSGQNAHRDPIPTFDSKYYAAHHMSADDDYGFFNSVVTPFMHYLAIGRYKGLSTNRSAVDYASHDTIDEAQSRSLFALQAYNVITQIARHPLDFSFSGPPDVSVILVVHNKLHMTLLSLQALRASYPGKIQVIIVDSGSEDGTRHIKTYIKGAVYLRYDYNVEFVHGCNAALSFIEAEVSVFLNNDTYTTFGAISAGLDRLKADPTIGAVGGKILKLNGALQEAGSIIWRDGGTLGYLRNQPAVSPEANFVRDVDFCSAVFLMLRTDLLKSLDGFDRDYAPAYYEDTDLCVRIWKAGFRVVYDPSIVIHHYEFGSSTSEAHARQRMKRNQKIFINKHYEWLRTKTIRQKNSDLHARSAGARKKRILFIEDNVPLPSMGSGYVRSNDIIHALNDLGYDITIYPMRDVAFEIGYLHAAMPDTVEIVHTGHKGRLAAFMRERAGFYDYIWVCRAHNLNYLKEALDGASLGAHMPKIIFDTEAIFSSRRELQAQLQGQDFEFSYELNKEFKNVGMCNNVITVNEKEAEVISTLGVPKPMVLDTVRKIDMTKKTWSERSGLLFVGSLHSTIAPNYDSLEWFIHECLPIIEKRLGSATRLTIAGYVAPVVPQGGLFDHRRVTLMPNVEDLRPLYNAHRVFIAPTRFAAGTPYKLYEAASYGIPMVASDVLARQVGWHHGQELFVAECEAERFAEQVLEAYLNEEKWKAVRTGAEARLRQANTADNYRDKLRTILEI